MQAGRVDCGETANPGSREEGPSSETQLGGGRRKGARRWTEEEGGKETLPCQYLSLTKGNSFIGVHGQPHLRQVLPHRFGAVPGMSDVGAAGKEREIELLSSCGPSRPRTPASRTPAPSPLDPRRCLPSSIPVQTLSVNIVPKLLLPSLALGLGHRANHSTNSSLPAPTFTTSC